MSLKIAKKFPQAVSDFEKAQKLNPNNHIIEECFKRLVTTIGSIQDQLPHREVHLPAEKPEYVKPEASANFKEKTEFANQLKGCIPKPLMFIQPDARVNPDVVKAESLEARKKGREIFHKYP